MRNALFAVLLSTLPLTVLASDWPTHKHNVMRNPRTPDSVAAPLRLRWSFASSERPRLAWPGPGGNTIEGLQLRHRLRFDDVFQTAVVGGRVYFGSSVDNHIYCVDGDSGAIRWTYCTGGPVRVAPTVVNGRVYAASDDGLAYCLDAGDGGLIWQRRAALHDERILARGRMSSRWPVRTSVLVDEGVAYFGAGTFPHETVYLYAVDAASGEIVWRNDTISQQNAGRNDLTPQGYLLASDELLFVPSGRTLPAAFDRTTGEFVHKQRGGGKQVGGTEVVLTHNQIYTIGEHEILTMSQEAGEIFSKMPARQIVLDGEQAYLAADGSVFAVDHAKYTQAFANSDLRAQFKQAEDKLQNHNALRLAGEIEQGKLQLADLKSRMQDTAREYGRESIEFQEINVLLAARRSEQSARIAQLKIDGAEYNAQREAAESLIGIRWRTKLPHESALICTGNAVIVGGSGEVVVLSSDTGEIVWRESVEGNVRGLAFSDGFLTASTTAGRVYCFGDASHSARSALKHHQNQAPVFADDALTPEYSRMAGEIIESTGVRRGYCLVAGSDDGRLAYELAKRSALKIYCIESDFEKVRRSREAFRQAGLYGSRIVVDHVDLSVLPHPNYFANLVVSDTVATGGLPPCDPKLIARCVKPIGGKICLQTPASAEIDAAHEWLARTGLLDEGAAIEQREAFATLTRGALPGADSWSHQYGNAANTMSVRDRRVRGGLQVLWYGDPGPSTMLNRHVGAVGPLSVNGRLFVQGDESILAYDAYNGEFLWETANPGAMRTGVFMNHEPGNLAATADRLYCAVKDKCLELDAATGSIWRTFAIPGAAEEERAEWGYVACVDGVLFGTSTRRELLPEEEQRRGILAKRNATDVIFAYDLAAGELLWEYEGQSVVHTTIAIGDGKVMFINSSITSEQRQALLQQDKSELLDLTGQQREFAEQRLKNYDARLAVALDAQSGAELWSRPVDVTDCSEIGTGGGRLTLMYRDGYIVLCGANANGHYWEQFLAGEFERRRLVVLSAETGEKVWAKDANYRHRPVIVEDQIIAEPWALQLATGEQVTSVHPITGKQTPWMFIRPGHHCGAIAATPNMLFFRSGFTAYYDLNADSGTRHFGGHRLGCWVNTIPANGLLLVPEASAGCACLFSLTSTIAFEPRGDRQVWGVYAAQGPTKPVNRLAVNFGAPGDRRDARGKLWLGYPRPSSRPGLELPIDVTAEFLSGGEFIQRNAESDDVDAEEAAWIYSSGARNASQIRLPLVSSDVGEANYEVTLYFVADSESTAASAVDVALQGKPVMEGLELASSDGTRQVAKAVFENVVVAEALEVTIQPVSHDAESPNRPVLAGIEVSRNQDE